MALADELDELIAYEVADKAIPSISYALFDRNDVLASQHQTRGTALGESTRFRIGSISKTFAALQAIQLVERGKLDLDQPISAVLPAFAPRNPFAHLGGEVTLRKLLSHRSGLTREAGVGHYLDDSNPPLAATVASLARSTLKAPADGGSYFYSNGGYAVVGATIEHASGRAYADNLEQEILGPLGLNHTVIALTAEVRAALAPAQMWTADRDFPAPVFDLGSAPAGNIFATLGDLTAYARMLLRGGDGLIAPDSLETMWSPAGPQRPTTGYGLGFSIDTLDGHRSVGHGGVVYGYASSLLLLPDDGLGVIVFGTLDCSNEIIGRIGRRALRLALATRGQGTWPRPARRLPPAGVATAAALAGSYAAPGGATVELRAVGTRLVLLDDGVPIEIRPIGQGRFVLDGRLYGEETPHPFPALELAAEGDLRWKNVLWSRTVDDLVELPPELAPHLGSYGPSFMPAELRYANGELHCLMEYFSSAVCTPLGGPRYLMRGGMYDRETLELGVRGSDGAPAIRVGEMVLDKRRD